MSDTADLGQPAGLPTDSASAAQSQAAPVIDASLDQPTVDAGERKAFEVRVTGFEGPFDLLLSLIAKHKLEVTVLALHDVTDDFIKHVRAQGEFWDLDETTEFLVVAAILLDLKAARLLPGESEEDAEDIALLEARDLLFARLMQYRAFKDVSALFEAKLNNAPPRVPRTVGLDPGLAQLLPDVVMGISGDAFAQLAVAAMTPKPEPSVSVSHVHAPPVNVREQAFLMVEQLRTSGSASFTELTAQCPDTPHVIARFLGLLDLYRQKVIAFEQVGPLAELHVTWQGSASGDVFVNAEFDESDETAQRVESEPV
ncbi:MAG: segregation/condensation protein A [Actinomycetia bacterium]|nr:segregation/condensation protein A [Actinomycetes bacterium]